MARPGYNEDNSLNVAPTGTPVGRPNPHTSTGFSVNDNAGTGTTTGRPNPHTDTGFSGGQTLAGGGNNPGFQDNFFPPNNQNNQPIIPPPNTGDGDGETAPLTGSGSSGGSSLNGYGTYLSSQLANDFLGKRKTGYDGLIQDNLKTYNITGNQNIDDFTKMEPGNVNTGVDPSLLQPTFKPDDPFQLGGDTGFQYNLKNPGQVNYNINDNIGLTAGVNPFKGTGSLGLNVNFAHGGPVGLMSLPHDYADGGQVMPATSIDPTADDYFLKEFYKYMKRYLPGYDKEQDYYRQEKNRERMKREAPTEEEYPIYDPDNPNHFMAPEDYKGYDPDSTPPSEKNPIYDPENPNHFKVPEGMDPELFKPGTPTLEAAEGGEVKPFGGTRERVLDQVEAFDNAPVHMEEPNINMYGKSVPLTIARKAQKYMQSLDPVKRGLVQEMLDMFQRKKQQEMMQEGQQQEQLENNFFGPNPSYKNSMNI